MIHPRHRGPILAFYEFVRTADDIADHPSLPPQEKLALLDRLEASLLGSRDDDAVGVALRAQLDERQLSPRHAQDLLTAFRLDVTKLRYRDWDDLIDYCRYSAMPVGRFVLDVHGESRATWGRQRRAVRGAADHQSSAGLRKGLSRARPGLHSARRLRRRRRDRGIARRRARLAGVARCPPHSLRAAPAMLLRDSRPFSASIEDTRLALEVAVIQTFAERLVGLLATRDPLSERVHLGKAGVAGFGARWPDTGAQAAASAASSRPPTNRRMRERWRSARAFQTRRPPQRASGSSFYTAMRILPRAQREAMFEIYSFCRQVDDIADSPRPAR